MDFESPMQRAGLTLGEIPNDIECSDCGLKVNLDQKQATPEEIGWLHETTGKHDLTVKNYCPSCRVKIETEQTELTEVQE
jgi:Zn finger protein HypA/HybF involved in hydrogenase expression